MLTLQEIKARLQPMNLKHVSRETGVSYNALWRLANEKSQPRYETVELVSKWLESNNGK